MNAFVLFALTITVTAVVATHNVGEDCWDTGCQLSSWKVRGCEQYGRYSKATRPCQGGTIYTCCLRGSVEVKGRTVKHPNLPREEIFFDNDLETMQDELPEEEEIIEPMDEELPEEKEIIEPVEEELPEIIEPMEEE